MEYKKGDILRKTDTRLYFEKYPNTIRIKSILKYEYIVIYTKLNRASKISSYRMAIIKSIVDLHYVLDLQAMRHEKINKIL